MSTSTHLLLPYLLAAQAQKHVTVNGATAAAVAFDCSGVYVETDF